MTALPSEPARRIALLDTLAADALPCAESQVSDGWRLRFNHGVTRRANSVLAEAPGELPLDEKIAAAEVFYRGHGMPTRFQISPASQPPLVDEVLERRGYLVEPGALMQVCTPQSLTASGGDFAAVCEALPSPEWQEVLASVDAGAAERSGERAWALQRADIAAYHCRVERGGVVLAVGLGVHLNGTLGLFNMATRPQWRRQGAARAVVAALAGSVQPLDTIYLQVDVRNISAQALYERLGFTTLYEYHYRVGG